MAIKDMDVSVIPSSLKALNQWVLWGWGIRGRKRTKIPISPRTGRSAAVNDPDSWGTFEDAYKLLQYASGAEGLGFVFTVDDPFAGIDFDKCIENGVVRPEILATVNGIGSYAEISPSGTGIKVIVKATVGRGRRANNVEVYDRGRFFTITSRALEGCQREPEERQADIDGILEALGPKETTSTLGGSGASCPTGPIPDADLYQRIERSKQGPKFTRLWNGDISGYESHSEADMALCNILAFWCRNDETQIDRMFRGSGLFRSKWDEKRGSISYGAMTIITAVEHRIEIYDPWGGVSDGAAHGESETILNVEEGTRLFVWSSELRILQSGNKWLWEGYLNRGGVTLLSAYWKAGKTTLMSHMLKAFETGGEFCGKPIVPAKVLVISEEDENTWAERRDVLGLKDNAGFACRPFIGRPSMQQWNEFLTRIHGDVMAYGFDLVILDTLSKLWPVKDENSASQVDEALMPLWKLARDKSEKPTSVMISHHLRKGDGAEATSSRGSGALTAFVETIIELRRYDAGNKKSCKRVLTGYGRFKETPEELVVDLTASGYVPCGDKQMARELTVRDLLMDILPKGSPGMTRDDFLSRWPGDSKPRLETITEVLNEGLNAGVFGKTGTGKKGSPYYYFVNEDIQTND